MAEAVELHDVTVAGRVLKVRTPSKIQLLKLSRASKLSAALWAQVEDKRGDAEDEDLTPGQKSEMTELATKGLDEAAVLLDLVERLVVDKAERAWLVELMLEGEIDLEDVLPIIRGSIPDKPVAKKPRKAVRG